MVSDIFGGGWCGKTIGPGWTLEDRCNEMASHGWRSRDWLLWPTPDAFPAQTIACAFPASQVISQATTETLVRRVGRFVLAALDDATYATVTH